MARYQVKGPDGAVHVFEGPDGATPDQVLSVAQQMFSGPSTADKINNDAISQGARNFARDGDGTAFDAVKRGARDAVAGLVRGAGSIGATIAAPYDYAEDYIKGDRGKNLSSLVTGKELPSRNAERRARLDENARELLGANTDSLAYKGGKLTGEVAGSAGAGGAVANGARALGAAPELVTAIGSGGFSGGGNMLTRAAGGVINGAATAGLVNPEDAVPGAVIGGALPPGVKLAGMAGNALSDVAKSGARKLMQSAIKPTLAQRASGDADTAIETLLQYGISPNKGGVNKLRDLIDGLNTEIGNKISSSTATVPKQKVLDKLDEVRDVFRNQVSPTKDLAAIEGVGQDFAAHPNFPLPQTSIPVQDAQKLKQGTYKVLQGKYGEAGSAETEAQKGLARGLKEEVANAVPGIQALNEQESRLIKTLDVSERRALLEMNKNPVGLTALAKNPLAAAGFMADRSAAFKAIAARLINNAAVPAAGYAGQKAIGAASNPLLRSAGLVATETNP
jgi:hypothetical protein